MRIDGIGRAVRSYVALHSGEVCPLPPSSATATNAPAESGPRLREQHATHDDDHVEYVAFTADSGSVSKMAIVRRRIARVLGRYVLGEPIAAGGMATVHLGRLVGPAGFSRTVAVKRLHAHLAANPEFVERFVDEARIASRVRHANVVQTLDVVSIGGELLLVLDYVHGESLARLRRLASEARIAIPPNIASSIVIGTLRGLHAAHESKTAKGAPMEVVHRDVSPQNILVGADGIARVLDFGIAKAAGRIHQTETRDIRGKLAYMAPEQLSGEDIDRRTDIFAVGVVLWEALAGERLFRSEDSMATMHAIYNREAPLLSERELGIRADVDDVLARALAKDSNARFDTADAMARAIEAALPPASDREVAEWVEGIAGDVLAQRLAQVAEFERDDTGGSEARLFAAEPSELATARRDALAPPPLDSVTNENVSEYRRGTMPTLETEASTALAAAARLATAGGPPGSVAIEGVSELRPMHTPLVMISPSDAVHESGPTRIEPVERRARLFRTPIPMPFPLSKKRRAPSVFQLALLVVIPPIIVAVGLSRMGASPSAAAALPETAEVAMVVVANQAVTAPPAPAASAATATNDSTNADAGGALRAAGAAKPDKKTARPPGHRPLRPAKAAAPIPASRQ